jgi:hypothetical protein
MEVKNTTLSTIRGMRKCGSGVEFDAVVVERHGAELREYHATFYTDGKFVATYLLELGKLERATVPYSLPTLEDVEHGTAH